MRNVWERFDEWCKGRGWPTDWTAAGIVVLLLGVFLSFIFVVVGSTTTAFVDPCVEYDDLMHDMPGEARDRYMGMGVKEYFETADEFYEACMVQMNEGGNTGGDGY